MYSAEGVLKEKQQQVLLVINGTDFPEFTGKLHEHIQERDEMVTYLPDISGDGQLSRDMAQCLLAPLCRHFEADQELIKADLLAR